VAIAWFILTTRHKVVNCSSTIRIRELNHLREVFLTDKADFSKLIISYSKTKVIWELVTTNDLLL